MYLRSDVHLAQLDQDIVLLDVRQSEYLCLPDAAAVFDRRGDGVKILDEDLAHQASELGLLGQGWRPDQLALIPAGADVQTITDFRASARDIFAFLAAYGVLVKRYYRRPFGELITYARDQGRGRAPALITPELLETVQAFRRLLPWAPFEGVCLYRSFYLLAFLRLRGFDATWMFGVRTWPFEAHCWLQLGDTVLDDSLDHVRSFSPILGV